MQDVIYPGPYEAVQLADGTVCPQGEPVKVKNSIAESLINQGFLEAKPEKPSNDNKNEGK